MNVPIFVKWAGGKKQLLEKIEPFFPKKINRYLDPFVGGGAVFFYVKQKYDPKDVILSDKNGELINCYLQVKNNLNRLMGHLKNHHENFLQFSYDKEIEQRKNYYYSVRAEDPSKLSNPERAARTIFLNKTCFNGLYRVNKKGEFNVPIGDNKNPTILMDDVLREAKKLLKGVDVAEMNFEKVEKIAKKGDFVYLDPPYHPINGESTNFTYYTKKPFRENEQKKLAKLCNDLNKKGCKIMHSNSDTEFIRDLYNSKRYRIEPIKARRPINSNGKNRGAIDEVLIVNY